MSHLRGRSGGGSPSAGPSPPAHSRPPASLLPAAAAAAGVRRTWRAAALFRPRGRLEAAASGAAGASRGTSWARSTACHPRRARSLPPFVWSGTGTSPPAAAQFKRTKSGADRECRPRTRSQPPRIPSAGDRVSD